MQCTKKQQKLNKQKKRLQWRDRSIDGDEWLPPTTHVIQELQKLCEMWNSSDCSPHTWTRKTTNGASTTRKKTDTRQWTSVRADIPPSFLKPLALSLWATRSKRWASSGLTGWALNQERNELNAATWDSSQYDKHWPPLWRAKGIHSMQHWTRRFSNDKKHLHQRSVCELQEIFLTSKF